MKTYSRKGNVFPLHQQQHDEVVEDALDDGPLIRLGEGIVVDWNPGAHDGVYNGEEGDPDRGRPTYAQIEMMPDPELEAKRKARMHRKKKGLTLEECLDEFGKEEILSEMDTWYCPRCKEHRRASKKFELWKTPDILVMHLKRFSSNAMRRDKLDVYVDFPIENLDLTSRVVEQDDGKQEVYDLFAVDDHWGGLGGGHYTAFAKSFIDNKWYEYNGMSPLSFFLKAKLTNLDSSVSEQKDTSRIVSAGAYLLFYRRRSEVPLGGPRFKEIIDRYNNPPDPSEDENESGEYRRLVADSSLRGSSSALTGVGVVHQAAGGSGGVAMTRSVNPLASGGVALRNSTTINPADLDKPPSYEAALGDDEAAPLMADDTVMNDGLDVHGGLEDEGIDVNMGYNNFNTSRNAGALLGNGTWTFSAIHNLDAASSTMANPSGRNSDIDPEEIDGRSDIVQNNSSASEGSRERRVEDFDNAEPDEEWEEPIPIPDVSEQDQMAIMDLHGDLLAQGPRKRFGDMEMEVKVPPNLDEEVAEIHLEEGEDIKID
jgi:ubiquitin carboxyl-terminal hydrolase 4/11